MHAQVFIYPDEELSKIHPEYYSGSKVARTRLRSAAELPPGASQTRKCLCFLKTSEIRVTHVHPGHDVMVIEVSHGPLKHLLHVCRDALFPLLSLPQNKRGLTASAVKEFAFACEEFACELEILCGKIDGDILLPLPTSFDPGENPELVALQREVHSLSCFCFKAVILRDIRDAELTLRGRLTRTHTERQADPNSF